MRTIDEAEPNPRARVKPFPCDLAYLRHAAAVMQGCQLLWVPKSRRVVMTWLHSAELLWRCLQPNTHVFLQTQKEEAADWLIKERVYFLFEFLPEWFRYVAFSGSTQVAYKYCKLAFPNGSKAWGVPQGPDQFRGYTPSAVFVDEAAYQDEFDAAHTAILPLAEKGCALRFVSSARPSYFGQIVRGPVRGAMRNPLPGIREWDLQKGGHVLEVHYTADPHKDPNRQGRDWLEETSSKYPGGTQGSKWQQEMEIGFDAYSGQLVYEGWDRSTHVVPPMDKDTLGPWWRSADYGIRNPFACLWIAEDGQDESGRPRYHVHDEFFQSGMTTSAMKQAVYSKTDMHRIEATWIDPRSDRHEQVDEVSPFYNLNLAPYSMNAQKANSSGEGIGLIRQWLHDGRLTISSRCVNLIREIENYRYEDWGTGVEQRHNLKEKTLKKDDHLCDALKYFANGVQYREARRETPKVIPIRSRRDEILTPRSTRYIGRHSVMRGYR